MAPDTFTEVTKQSWFSRIGGAAKGVIFGLVLFLLAFPLLFWNEGRAVERQKTLNEGGGAVVSVPVDKIDAANEGKLIHITGMTATTDTLTDDVFGVSDFGLKLKRNVEMYQWEESSSSETKDKLGGGQETVTTYTYAKTWSNRVINSAEFKEPAGHQNPNAMPFESKEFVAEPVTVGAFTLSPSLVDRIGGYGSLPLPAGTPVPMVLKGRALLYEGGFYVDGNPLTPSVGDTRITFQTVSLKDVSIVAAQKGSSFAPYQAKTGGKIELLEPGIKTPDEMFQAAQESNKVLSWVLRFAGFLVMFMGLTMILKPLSVMADVVPFIGNIVGAGTGFISFLVAAALSLTTIGIAWVFSRPLLGFSILAVVVALVVAIVWKVKSAKPQPAPAGA